MSKERKMGWYGYPPYVPVAVRKRQAAKLVEKLKKKGQILYPVVIDGRMITKTFWGKSWCKNLEAYSDFANRLPRGRTYIRNGSVIDLTIDPGEVKALVNGSSVYEVNIMVSHLPSQKWENLVHQCSGKIESLIELLQGKFSKGVMEIMTQPENGLFPHPQEITFHCSCPDYALMCKHVAAVLYGIGARIDEQPETLFLLRQANHMDLIKNVEWSIPIPDQDMPKLEGDLASLFGINFGDSETSRKKDSTPIKKVLTKKNRVGKKKSKGRFRDKQAS